MSKENKRIYVCCRKENFEDKKKYVLSTYEDAIVVDDIDECNILYILDCVDAEMQEQIERAKEKNKQIWDINRSNAIREALLSNKLQVTIKE